MILESDTTELATTADEPQLAKAEENLRYRNRSCYKQIKTLFEMFKMCNYRIHIQYCRTPTFRYTLYTMVEYRHYSTITGPSIGTVLVMYFTLTLPDFPNKMHMLFSVKHTGKHNKSVSIPIVRKAFKKGYSQNERDTKQEGTL
jgi:hypothetical protein